MNIIELGKRSEAEDKDVIVKFRNVTDRTYTYDYFEPVFVSPIKSSYIDNSDLLGYVFFRNNLAAFFFKSDIYSIEIGSKIN